MKIILSRKGFDSKYGGYANPILPDGRMISLPIPGDGQINYCDLQFDNETYYDLMRKLKPKVRYEDKWHCLTKNTKCHLDPDIRKDIKCRKSGWKACFGQCENAQAILKNQGVVEDDLFLFFGWFKHVEHDEQVVNGLKFSGNDIHVIFGYMQIGEIISIDSHYKEPDWMKGHPHLEKSFDKKNNVIYAASEKLSWNEELPGAGVFNFNKKLVLTKHGLSRSKWCLPNFFKEDKIKIGFHNESNWKDGYFQSAMIGQEFVIEENKDVEKWAKDKINAGMTSLVFCHSREACPHESGERESIKKS
jgi:hypothetical protein